MHADADVDGHFFEGFLASVPVNDVVAQVESGFEGVDGSCREHFFDEGMRVFVVSRAMNMGVWRLVMIFSCLGQGSERIGAGIECHVVQVVLSSRLHLFLNGFLRGNRKGTLEAVKRKLVAYPL